MVSDCAAEPTKLMSVRAKKKGSKTLVLPLSKDGKVCITTSQNAKLVIKVRRAWTASNRRYTVTEVIKVLESADGKKVPSKTNVVRVKLGKIEGLPAKVTAALVSVTATGGKKSSSIRVAKCGTARKLFLTVKAGETGSAERWVTLRGGDLCISATSPTPVIVNVLGIS
jgi:hypothetical protein